MCEPTKCSKCDEWRGVYGHFCRPEVSSWKRWFWAVWALSIVCLLWGGYSKNPVPVALGILLWGVMLKKSLPQ